MDKQELLTMNYQKILLTGAAGLLGKELRKFLSQRIGHLRSTDIVPMTDPASNEELIQADLGDVSVAPRLVDGMDAIVHFGGLSKEADFASICRVNIAGTQSLYEAARLAGVKRIVFASSVHAVGFYEQTDVITSRSPARPDSNYGLGKVFGEALAQLYWDKFGLETVSIRIGSCEPVPSNRRHLLSWLSFEDMLQLVEKSLTAPRVGHAIVFGSSDNSASFWDNCHARFLGYRPASSADNYRESILQRDPHPNRDDVVMRYQGGIFVN
jgi:uronate dehydrogenase